MPDLPVMNEDNIVDRIIYIRGQKVMLDTDLADLYGVKTKRLNEQVKRNISRFPADFMFRLTDKEVEEVVAICDHLQKLKFSHTNPDDIRYSNLIQHLLGVGHWALGVGQEPASSTQVPKVS